MHVAPSLVLVAQRELRPPHSDQKGMRLIVEFAQLRLQLVRLAATGRCQIQSQSTGQAREQAHSLLHNELERGTAMQLEAIPLPVHRTLFGTEAHIGGSHVAAVEKRVKPLPADAAAIHIGQQLLQQCLGQIILLLLLQLPLLLEQIILGEQITQTGQLQLGTVGHIEAQLVRSTEQHLAIVIAAVIADVLAYELLGAHQLRLQQAGGILEHPLAMRPGVIVAGTAIRGSFANANLVRPIDGISA